MAVRVLVVAVLGKEFVITKGKDLIPHVSEDRIKLKTAEECSV